MITRDAIDILDYLGDDNKIVCTSGGFAPIHLGHLNCLLESATIAKNHSASLVIIVNGDGFLMRKKGFVYMTEDERAAIVHAVKGVDHVLIFDDGTQFVTGAIKQLRPIIFTKGGDRSSADKVPEFELCQEISCAVKFGIGGTEKIQSSTDLIDNENKHK